MVIKPHKGRGWPKGKKRGPMSEAHKRKISDAHKGKSLSEETKRKISEGKIGKNNPNYGKPAWNAGKKTGPLSEEHKRKLSEAMKGEKNPNWGKHLSDEHRRKTSEAGKGRIHSKEHRRKIGEALIGKKRGPPSEETKRKISEANRGKPAWNKGIPRTDETRKKISATCKGKNHPFYGKKHSLETRRKMSRSQIGKHHTEKTKAKIRAARLKQVFPEKDTSIERLMQSELDRRNVVYDTHVPVCGVCIPDIVFPNKKVTVECDGDYWHRLPDMIERDNRQNKILHEAGWSVLRFWGSEINDNVSHCVDIVEATLEHRRL